MNVEDLASRMGQALADEQAAAASLGHAVGVDHELQSRAGQAEALFDAGAAHTLAGIGSLGLAGENLRQFQAGVEEMARMVAAELPDNETELVRQLIAQLLRKARMAVSQANTMTGHLAAEHSVVQRIESDVRHLGRQPDAGRLQQTSRLAAEHTQEGLDRL